MGVSRGPGYLLPDGDAFTDEQQCCFVYLPAGDEYRRAFFGALDYFGTWLAWERDAGKRGKDAARAWKIANELTRECWEMGTCDLMVSELQAIRLLLSEQHCCDGNNTITYYDNRVVTTTVVPYIGDSPAAWGESETPADWDDWAQYVCYHAHVWVDNLIAYSETLDDLVGVGSWAIDFLGFIISSITYTPLLGLPVPVSFSFVNKISAALIAELDNLEFNTMASKLESARGSIVCAFLEGTSLEDAVQDAVDDSLLWTVFYGWFDYESTVATIYTGEVPGVGYLPPSQRADCECDEYTGQFIPDPDFDGLEWTVSGLYTYGSSRYTTVAPHDKPIDFPNMKSPTFYLPAGGVPDLQFRIKAYDRPGQPDFWGAELVRDSDDHRIDNVQEIWDGLTGTYVTKTISDLVDITDYYGELCYVRIKLQGDSEVVGGIDTVELWDADLV